MVTTLTATERAERIEGLRKRLPVGTTIYTVLRSVSASETYRRISAFYILPNSDRLVRLDGDLLALGLASRPRGGAEGVGVTGIGMDMGFHLVYSLGRTLWPDGFTSQDNLTGEREERDGGYAYSQRWL